tara:strand:+ start:121 stop:522 length:402 start_codon:yes stop_codon:yes gene_type:complete
MSFWNKFTCLFFGKGCPIVPSDCCKTYDSCPSFSEDTFCSQNFPCPQNCPDGYYREINSETNKVGDCKKYIKSCGVNQYRNSKHEKCRDVNTREFVESFSLNNQQSDDKLLEYLFLIILLYLCFRLTKLVKDK